ncbi:hypothetical protein [Streptomyces erythrochromogenes]|uniref:hypothetical protein n=1 Tax=Streptomyces erythrochromogenes TaxID=285574 RepID=UPI0036A4700B
MTEPSPSAPITLVLPDGQTIERVRLYERQQLDSGLWMYRIGVPLWQTTAGPSPLPGASPHAPCGRRVAGLQRAPLD